MPMASEGNPWSVPVVVMQIPEAGLHRDIEASAAVREAIARLGDLNGVASATASFDLSHAGDGRVRITGRVKAQVCQTCVVTLDPVDNIVDEPIDLLFMPAEQIRDLADLVDDGGEPDAGDPPEAIERGLIDLGRVATDALYLGLDPYPRKPDAVFESPAPAEDDEHPFAALKALQTAAEPPRGAKPKRG
jgi:hypothetical protein